MQKGSLVICIASVQWEDVDTKELASGPALGEMTVISGFQSGDYLEFEEYPEIQEDGLPGAWHKRWFEEVQPPVEIKIDELLYETT